MANKEIVLALTPVDIEDFYNNDFSTLELKTNRSPNYYCNVANHSNGYAALLRVDGHADDDNKAKLGILEWIIKSSVEAIRVCEKNTRGGTLRKEHTIDLYEKVREVVELYNDLREKPILVKIDHKNLLDITMDAFKDYALILTCLFNPNTRNKTISEAVLSGSGLLNKESLYSIAKEYGIYKE